MKWKSTFTPEEAALIATGLTRFKSIQDADDYTLKIAVMSAMDKIKFDKHFELAGVTDEQQYEIEYQKCLNQIDAIEEDAKTAKEICEALKDELAIAGSLIEVAIFSPNITECKATRESLARWFWQHNPGMAKKFWPSISEENTQDDSQEATPQERPKDTAKEPAPKTVNAYLRTIVALSEALIDGFTGMPNKDAETVLSAIAAKGIEGPVSKKTLVNYLKQAKEV